MSGLHRRPTQSVRVGGIRKDGLVRPASREEDDVEYAAHLPHSRPHRVEHKLSWKAKEPSSGRIPVKPPSKIAATSSTSLEHEVVNATADASPGAIDQQMASAPGVPSRKRNFVRFQLDHVRASPLILQLAGCLDCSSRLLAGGIEPWQLLDHPASSVFLEKVKEYTSLETETFFVQHQTV